MDSVISDNRYGLWHKDVPSAFVCHQLAPLPPFGGKAAHWLSYKLHRRFLRQFDHIWIPDFPGENNLSGKLSHYFGQNDPRLKWPGPLSRFAGFENKPVEKKWAVVALLSGPEPQRSMLERALSQQLSGMNKKGLIIQGKPDSSPFFEEKSGYTLCNYLSGEALAATLLAADAVIARPGYSSLMDFAALGLKQLVLVPTPGQTEQEYLARRLSAEGRVWTEKQRDLSLARGLKEVKACTGLALEGESEYRELLEVFLRGA
ncbi:MAG: glycosyltransferase [Bacteroidia bacterium]